MVDGSGVGYASSLNRKGLRVVVKGLSKPPSKGVDKAAEKILFGRLDVAHHHTSFALWFDPSRIEGILKYGMR
jgi:hypothetical protein